MAIISKKYAHLNTADSGSLHKKLDATEAYITGSLTAASTFHVVGESQHDAVAKFGDAASVITLAAGAGLANIDIAAEGDAVLGGKLAVMDNVMGMGAASFDGQLYIGGVSELSGAVTANNGLTVKGAAQLQSTLEVQGNADMRDVLPNADLSYSLGSATKRWAEIHAGTAAFEHLDVDYLDVAVTASVAQLTGSAGAKFTAGDVLVDAGKVQASGDLQAGGMLIAAGDADLNGKLDVALASDLHGAVIAYSTLNVQGAADLDSTLNVDGAADFKSTLFVTGAVELDSTLLGKGGATFASSVAVNGAGVALSVANSASIGGDLTIVGDLIVQGEQVILDTVTLQVEDKNIEIAKVASPTDITANGAGITIKGANDHTVLWYNDRANGVDGFSVNDHWLPEADNTYDLGIAGATNYRWRDLKLAGAASIGGALSAGAVSAASLAVAGAATFGASIAVAGTGSFTGNIDAFHGLFSGDVSAQSASFGGDLSVQGTAGIVGALSAGSISTFGDLSARSGSFSGDLTVMKNLNVAGNSSVIGSGSVSGDLIVGQALTAYGPTTLADLSVTGLSDLDTLNVTGTADFAQSIDVVGSGSFTGNLTAASASLSGDLDVYGTATFHGVFAVPGTGDFGSLVVGGINMSPISSSNPVSTVNANSATMLGEVLVSGDMAKYEIEVVARGGSNAAAWKISVAAMHDGTEIQAAATELSKEFFGALGANLDVDVQVSGGNLDIIAKGAAGAGTVYWDAQIVKKMVLDSANGARKY